MKMWVESRPARSKPEGVTASRHADPAGVLSVHTTMLPSSSSSRASAYCARVPNTRMKANKKKHSKPKKFRTYIKKEKISGKIWQMIR